MKYTNRNGKQLSNMTLGTAQIGMNYGVANQHGKPSDEESYRMFESALSGGVTSIDTARYYGNSETRMGGFFKSPFFRGDLPFITTKFRIGLKRPRSGGGVLLSESELRAMRQECEDLGPGLEKRVFENIEQSLTNLNLKKVNCVLLHDPIEMMAGGALLSKAMGKLVTAGYTDEVGASVYFPEEVDFMCSLDEYSATQMPCSLFDQKMIRSGALKKLKEKGFVVFIRSVFLQGVFFLDPDTLEDPLLIEHAAPHIRKIRELALDEGVSIAQLAISFVRDSYGVTSLVLGCDTEEQLKENIKLMEGPSVSEKTMEIVRESFSDIPYEEIMTVLRREKD